MATLSTLMLLLAAVVKKVPSFRPLMMLRIVFSAMPLQITTEMPLSSAQHAERTLNTRSYTDYHA